ncbi:hypothetical protein AB1Y20_011412 [Prymnesium parvum]|uniref:Protein kinase domain-containing protein n=1 Tax=Prymnesium parvum TaxID=97485 RepID=A0AB34IMR9_PRYPA
MAHASEPPLQLADLHFRQQLGRGATSTVRLALASSSPPRHFAVKTVEKAQIAGEQALARLYREKELLSSLAHPGVVRLHCTLKDERCLYFVLECLDGGELLYHMRRAPRHRVPLASARVCVGALLLPLEYLQEQRVLYRDLKPTNILFTREGRLKLVDFGHAKRMAPHERSTSLCGTPHFHAPEVVRGEPHGLPAQLWALGVLIVEVIAGAPPFFARPAAPPLKEQILHAEIDLVCLPECVRPLAAALLQRDCVAREASFPRGFSDVRRDPWLQPLDWRAVEAGTCVPDFDFARHAEERVACGMSAPADSVSKDEDPFADFD